MGISGAERQRRYRQRHLSDGARLNIIISTPAKRALQRLAKHFGTTQRTVLEGLLEQAEVALLEGLSAEARRCYWEPTRRIESSDDTLKGAVHR